MCASDGVLQFIRALAHGPVHVTLTGTRIAGHANGVVRQRGEGLASGNIYEYNNALQSTFSSSLSNAQDSETFIVGSSVIIGHGQVQDLIRHITFRLTVNAYGEVTVDFLKETSECR
jgi:hypothetical protein